MRSVIRLEDHSAAVEADSVTHLVDAEAWMLLADYHVALSAVNAAVLVYDGATRSVKDLVAVEAENRTFARHK